MKWPKKTRSSRFCYKPKLTPKMNLFPATSKLVMICLLLTIITIFQGCTSVEETDEFKFQNTALSAEERADDLIGRMTLEEKVSQMINEAPAIERLGIPAYNWWAEGLHGVARAGLATVFPQAIGLGATWDQDMMFKVSTAISDEARAKHHDFVSKDKRFLYQGLTLWSPNINIFRDPRWGRGQETYGEDPYLTGKLAVQFIKGLQGDDPNYYKTIATVKHFAVHNGPEPERHSFDAKTNEKDFRETYLPQFEMGVKEGGAYSVMCAYNRYNGEACCGSDRLLNRILRDEWDFDGYVVSDCGAILDIHEYHKIVETPEESAALAVKSGTDLNCGKIYNHLVDAVAQNLITEEEIDKAVKRLFVARFKLGMFDPDEKVAFANIPYSVVDSKEHRNLALESARKSMVLLKNERNALPLSKDLKKVAVIGPNANQWLMLLGNYNGVPADAITPLRGIQEKLPNAEILYAQGSELAEGMPMFYTIPASALSHNDEAGLSVDYFNNDSLGGAPLFSEVSEALDVNWNDKAPRDDMDDDSFSVRWEGQITPDLGGSYQIGVITTCNTNLYLNDSLVASTPYHFRNEYGDPRLRKSKDIVLEAGKQYDIRIDAIESYADAQVQLVWAKPKPDLKKEALEAARDAEVVIMCMGITARMEGEEMDIEIDGFNGGDRTDIALPKIQQDLIKEIQAIGKPVILVLLNGSAIALNWENEHIPAILEAWYPGQAAGTAIADILFGDYNPAGRLPVTFYKSIDDLPPFEDYALSTQTYRYFEGEPLYPFGYGLSYSNFSYDNLILPTAPKAGEAMTVSVEVTNTSDQDGEEVVQLYVTHTNSTIKLPKKELKAFDRVAIKAGETKKVTLSLDANAFSFINDENERVSLPGTVQICVGGAQPETELFEQENGIIEELVLN